jgi:hypothetical protein
VVTWNGRGGNGHGAWDGDPELDWIFPDEPELKKTAHLLQLGRRPEPPLDPAFRAALRRRLMQEAWERAAPTLPWWRRLFAPRAMAWAGATVGVLLIAVVVYTLARFPAPPSTQVVVSSPLQGAHAVAETRPIELKFSQPMNTSSVEDSIQIQPATTVRTFQWVDGTTVKIVPQHGLAPNTQYQVTVTQRAKTREGQGLAGQPVVTFVTAPPPGPKPAATPVPTARPTPARGITTPLRIAASGAPSPAWSPDGSVLYVIGPTGQLQGFTAATGAAQPPPIAPSGVTLATVGPDGTVVYARDGQVVNGQTPIPGVQPLALGFQNGKLLALAGGQVQSLAGGGLGTAPPSVKDATAADFSPNGRRLAYLGASDLHLLDLTSGQDTDVGPASGLGAWSRDGSRYAYPAADGVYVTDGTGQGTKLVSLPGAASVSWSAATNQLLLTTPEALLVSDANGSGLRTLATGTFTQATWSPRGDASFWFRYQGSVWVATVLPPSGAATSAEDLVNQFMMARRAGNAALASSFLDASGKQAFSNLTLTYGGGMSRYYTLLVQPSQAVVRIVLSGGGAVDETLKIARDSGSGSLLIDGVTEESATLSSGPNVLEVVVTSTHVRVTFDSDLDAATAASGGVTINGVQTEATYDAGTRTVIVTSESGFTPGTPYQLTVNDSLRDVNHNPAARYVLTFTGPSS